ncbi:hypothetical protein JIN85_13875 [Luteolibacter pohnpeiensis]|uniref:Uncharacterized protein n=1 Tax=Luteolibacter pohnpeiensis TaxID=454153 RepID=A0A934S6G5_9BACT|nr:hypothetical protein [Luteolibacter pohnpeiensis]MBK1883511.1 hypothetical protein [Luteolibacter pohnpeiensis]
MKIPVLLSLLIVAIFILMGSHQQLKIRHLRDQTAALKKRSISLGIGTDPTGSLPRSRRRKTPEFTASSLIDLEQKLRDPFNGKNENSLRQSEDIRIEIFTRLNMLDASEFPKLLDDISQLQGLDSKLRERSISQIIEVFAQKYPKECLGLLEKNIELTTEVPEAVQMTLLELAKCDPFKALDWITKSQQQFPDVANDFTIPRIIQVVAAKDPALALQLLSDHPKNPEPALDMAIQQIKDASQRDAALAAFRQFLQSSVDQDRKNEIEKFGLESFFTNAGKSGFEAGSAWLEQADLSKADLELMTSDGLSADIISSDTSKWLNWMNDKLSPEQAETAISTTLANWTKTDYHAVAGWLNQQPEGRLKQTGIQSFASTLAAYEPTAAAEWALSLAPGDARQKTLQSVYEKWLITDPDAADAFAQKYQLNLK